MIQKQIGDKIRKKRIETDLSQEQLALLSGVTPTYLGQVERGERNPTVGFLEKVAESLMVDIIYFFEGNSERSEDYYVSQIAHHIKDLNEEQKNTILQLITMITQTM